MGKAIPKFTLLFEFVGHVQTADESRKSASTHMYDVSLPWPTRTQTPALMLDPETSEGTICNGELLHGVTCIAAKLNDPKIIQERPEGPTDSNGEGNSQFVVKEGAAPSCGLFYAFCTGCKAMEASVDAARDPEMPGASKKIKKTGPPHFHTLIVTTKDISDQGEPLTFNYGDEYWPGQVNIMKYELIQKLYNDRRNENKDLRDENNELREKVKELGAANS
jgi:hypothetical protein